MTRQPERPEKSEGKLAPPEYFFSYRLADVFGSWTMTVNGFPVDQRLSQTHSTRGQNKVSLNTALMDGANTLQWQIEPLLTRNGERLSLGPAEVSGKVTQGYSEERLVSGTEISRAQVDSAYAAWTERAEAQWQRYREAEQRAGGEVWALDSMRAWAGRHPLTVSTTFENESGPDFSSVFSPQAPRLAGTPADSARLLDYAIRLRDLLEAGNAEALYEEVKPAFEASVKQHPSVQTEPDSVYIRRIREGWLDNLEGETGADQSQVGLQRWAGGRVWELYREPGEPLLGGSKVYAGKIDGKLKVVRLE